jgi:hypothetical protein
VTLKRIIHVPEPGVHNPETGNTVLTCLVMADTRFGTMEIAGYQFGHDWEIAPGTWTIELWDGDRKLASQSFEAGPRESCILYAAACADGWRVGKQTVADGLKRRRRNAETKALRGRIAFAIRPDLVADAHALNEVGVTRLLDRGDVHEKVPAAIVRDDETVTLGRIEPLYFPSGHSDLPEDHLILG